MPAFYTITYFPDGVTKKFAGSRGNYYELSPGVTINVHAEPVWCYDCAGISEGERIESTEEIERRILDLQDDNSELGRMLLAPIIPELMPGFAAKFRDERLAAERQRLEWRRHRVSPPKCIVCGSTRLLALPDGQPVAHPSGTGSIVVRCVGMCSTGWNEWFFTPEGDRIPGHPPSPDLIREDQT
jgi:ferredoxin